MTSVTPSFRAAPRIHAFGAALLLCLLATACSSGPDEGASAGPDAGDSSSTDGETIAVAASDLIANDTTLFAVQGGNVVAIAIDSEEVTTLWEPPAVESDVETNIVFGGLSLLFANSDDILVRRSVEILTDQAQPVSSDIELWRVPIRSGQATLVGHSNDTRNFRGAAIRGDRIFTNSAYTVFSARLEDGEFLSSFGTDDDGNWVSNPVIDASDRLWFTRNSELYSAQSLGGGDNRLPAALSVSGAFAQASRIFPSAGGEDLLVWAPGAGIYQVSIGADAPNLLGFQTFAAGELFVQAARVNQTLWICDFEGVFEVGLSIEPRLVREMAGNCSIAAIGNEAFIADGTNIQRITVD